MDTDLDWISVLLKRKAEIDNRRAGVGLAMASYDRWTADALEVLLEIALKEKARPPPPEQGRRVIP